MTLTLPALPPLLVGSGNTIDWEKWFAFWSLPLDKKAEIIDEYPNLVITQPSAYAVIPSRKYFNPNAFDTQISSDVVFRYWDKVLRTDYPKQPLTSILELFYGSTGGQVRLYAWEGLSTMNYAVLAYKYRYVVRPEMFYFSMQYENELFETTSLDELMIFYGIPSAEQRKGITQDSTSGKCEMGEKWIR